MFVDDVSLVCKAGNGGNGCIAFRHEKFVPKGGPYGGNGGKGGSIIFVGDHGITTLLDLKYKKLIKAANGTNGAPKNCFGADAKDIIVKVPIGSIIHDLKRNVIIGDITKDKQEVVVAKGGKGGRGNTAFATSRVPAPNICEKGTPGDELEIRVELKILADVGLVGFPSVGKSTLLSVVSAARPKIADYHFTTLAPNLGVVGVKDGRSFVMADLPGLIKGASSGIGLGFQFLRHIERTRVIVHIVDMASIDGRDPYEDYLTINEELKLYNPRLLLRPQIIVANKMDMENSEENLRIFKEKIGNDIDIIPISAYTKNNLDALLYKIADTLETVSLDEFIETITDEVVEYTFQPEEAKYVITKDDDGVFNVSGKEVKKLFDATDFNNDDSVKLFARRLRGLGVDEALRKLGVKHGDTVRVLEYEFEFLD